MLDLFYSAFGLLFDWIALLKHEGHLEGRKVNRIHFQQYAQQLNLNVRSKL